MLTVGVGNAWGDTHTLGWGSATGSSGTYTNFTATSGTVTDIVSFSTAKHSEKNTPAYNPGSSELRLYNNKDGSPNYTTDGGSITLTPASGIIITGFTITATSGYQPTTKYKVGNGALTTLPAWSSNATSASGLSVNSTSSITIQNCNSSSLQLRIKTIQITYLAPTPCTITWHVNGGTTTAGSPTTSSTVGSKVTTLPTSPASAACDGSKVFVGWTETPIVGTTNTKPSDLFTAAAGAPTLTQAATHYYAVFATVGSSVTPTNVTSTYTSKAWADASSLWTSGKDGNALTSGRGVQVTKGVSGANATTKSSYNNVSSVVVTYSTNASDGAGTIGITVGETAYTGSASVTTSGGTTDRTITYTRAAGN